MKYILTIVLTSFLTLALLMSIGYLSFHAYTQESLSATGSNQSGDMGENMDITVVIQELESRIQAQDITQQQAERLRAKLQTRLEQTHNISLSAGEYQNYLSIQQETEGATGSIQSESIIIAVDDGDESFELSSSGMKVSKGEHEQFELNENGMFFRDGDESFELSEDGMTVAGPNGEHFHMSLDILNEFLKDR